MKDYKVICCKDGRLIDEVYYYDIRVLMSLINEIYYLGIRINLDWFVINEWDGEDLGKEVCRIVY